MKKLITQNRGLSQKQAIYSKIEVDTPTFTPVSNTFSQLLNQSPQNPQKEQKNSEQVDISQQNLLNESDGEWNKRTDESQIKFTNARVVYFPFEQAGEDQLNKDEQLLISDWDGYNDLVINSQLYHSEPENAHQIQKYNQYEVKNQTQIHISKQKQMQSSTIPQSLDINSSYPPQALSITDENAYKIQDGHIFSKELNVYNQKYLEYQTLIKNQAQYIVKLQQQASWNRQQLQSFKVTCQAKMEACLQVKELQILRLKQQIGENRKCISKLQQKIKFRAKMPNIVIEQYEIKSKMQPKLGEDIQNIQQQNKKIKFELSQNIRQSNKKICSLNQQIHSLKYLNQELKAHLNIVQTENRQLKHQISQINNKMIMRQNKVKKIMQKQLSKIRGLGAEMVGIAESQLHSHKRCKQSKQMEKSTYGEDNKIK